MENKNCLNCDTKLTDKYCSHCGQKADTHRITIKNFFFHDVLHGTFHIEKGILFTAKQALIRPGKAALDYISGKRKPYYNVFLLILLTIGMLLFIKHYYDGMIIQQGRGFLTGSQDLNDASKTIDAIFAQKSKIIIFLFVPFAAINSYFLFKRKKLNLSEHAIIAGMVLLGILLLSIFVNLIFFIDLFIEFSDRLSYIISISVTFLIFLYVAFAYFNAFGSDYSKLGFIYRMLLFFAFIFIEILLLLFIFIGIITNWEFGEVTISPF